MEKFENKVWLSSPTMHGDEMKYITQAYETNWMSTVGENINEIEKYKSRDLLITRDQAVDLEPDEYFITDLIGLAVVSDQGAELGILKDVLETGANDVYVVAMKDGKELMLPAIGDCILNVDLEQGRMEVHVLEGLMDL